MAKWQQKLDIKDIWQAADAGDLSRSDLCAEIARRLTAIEPMGDEEIDEEKDDIASDFKALSEIAPSEDDVNFIYDRLCDWGDRPLDNEWNGKKVCWIATF